MNTLRFLALSIFDHSEIGIYGKGLIDAQSGKPQQDLIAFHWIQSFCDRFRIVSRSQSGKLKLSPEKIMKLEKEVAFHLERLKRGCTDGELDQSCINNAEKTPLVCNMDYGRTLGFANDQGLRYSDVTSGFEEMTMLVCISGGANAIIEPPLMIFKNKTRNYPMRNVPENIPGVAYRTGPKGWMDFITMLEWLRESLVIKA